jgi:hypothetical protein
MPVIHMNADGDSYGTWAAFDAVNTDHGPVTLEQMAAAGWTVNQYREAHGKNSLPDGERLLSDIFPLWRWEPLCDLPAKVPQV